MNDIVRHAQKEYYKSEISRLQILYQELIAHDDDAYDALAKIVKEKIDELAEKLAELER